MMTAQPITLISTALGDEITQTDALGSAVWLWMNSPRHCQSTVGELPARLLTPVVKDQYLLAYEGSKPVFFAAWGWFDEAAEARYLDNPNQLLKEADWRSGDRLWFTDWIAPFGHTKAIVNLLKAHPFFSSRIVRFLGHRGRKSYFMYQLHGRKVSPAQNREYAISHPVKSSLIKE